MTLMMKACFFSLAILFLWQVQDGAEACTCMNIPPEQVFCRADVVFSAIVTGRQTAYDPSGNRMLRYNVQVTKVYKGPESFNAVYTSTSVGACGATLETTEEHYILTGWLGGDGTVHITMCDFHVVFYEMTVAQRTTLNRCTKNSCVC